MRDKKLNKGTVLLSWYLHFSWGNKPVNDYNTRQRKCQIEGVDNGEPGNYGGKEKRPPGSLLT